MTRGEAIDLIKNSHYICRECGEKLGTVREFITTFHTSTCDICKKEKSVCGARNYRPFTKLPPTDTDKVTRFEVIDHRAIADKPRAITAYGIKAELSYQDDGKTLKVFLTDREE